MLRKTCIVSFVFLRSQMRHLVPWTLTLAVPIVLFAVTYGLQAPASPESGAEVAMFFESYVVVTGILNNLILRWAQIRESGVLVQMSYMCGAWYEPLFAAVLAGTIQTSVSGAIFVIFCSATGYCSGLDAVLLIGATMWLVALLSCVAVLFLIPRCSITTISVWGSMLLLAMWCTAGGFGGGAGMNAILTVCNPMSYALQTYATAYMGTHGMTIPIASIAALVLGALLYCVIGGTAARFVNSRMLPTQ